MDFESVHRSVRAWAASTPDAPAAADPKGTITYGELDAAAELVAASLRADGVRRGDPVAVHLERSVELLIALLAVCHAGATAVLLNPAWPAELVGRSLRRARPVVTITATGMDHAATGVLRQADPAWRQRPGLPTVSGLVPCHPDEVAWAVFTSGSTGSPKAVEVTHRALAHRAATHRAAYRLDQDSRASWLTPPGSSIASVELWPVLTAGGSLHIPPADSAASPEDLRDWLVQQRVDVAFLTMPVGADLVALPWPEDTALRLAVLGGDSVHRWPSAALPFEVTVEYGCAEASAVTSCLVPPGRLTSRTASPADRPPVGRPWPDVDVVLLDERLCPVPAGEVGELFVGGPELARGYRADPAATAARFLPHPWRAGHRIYRTGDLARRDAHGRLCHLGRADRQLKIRGYRVEPVEVETVLTGHPGVRAAVVVGRPGPAGETTLVAYVVPTGALPAARALRAHLSARLAAPLVPALFVALPALPLTTAGKVDLDSLPEPVWHTGSAVPSADADPVVAAVRACWQRILGVAPESDGEDFRASGGDSLLAGRLLAAVREALGRRIRLRDFLREPTLSRLVELSRDAEQS